MVPSMIEGVAFLVVGVFAAGFGVGFVFAFVLFVPTNPSERDRAVDDAFRGPRS